MRLISVLKKQGLQCLVIILGISIFLRFYNTSPLFVFSGDEEHQLSIAQSIVENFHIEWVGVSSADTEFYLGSFWEYFGAFWLFISRGDPAIVAYVASMIGVLTTILVYLVGRIFFNKTVATISSFLYATLPLLVYYDKKFWNPALTSFTSLALLFSLYKTKDSPKWWILVAFVYGMVFHVHLSLVPLGIIVLYWFFKKGYHLSKNILVVCVLAFLVTISPLIGFEYFHKFSNTKTPIRVINMIKESPSRIDPIGHTKQLFKSMGRLWYLYPNRTNSDEVLHSCSPDFTNKDFHRMGVTTTMSNNVFGLSLFSFTLLVWFFIRKKTWKEKNTRLLGLFLATIIISYIFLPNTPLEYYLLGIFPLFLFIPGMFYDALKRKWKIIFLSLLIGLSVLGIHTVITADGSYGLLVKKILIEKTMDSIGDKKYELEADGLCHKYEGWRFLFKAYGRIPERSYSDGTLGWLYSNEITNQKADFIVLVKESRAGPMVPKGYITEITEGGFSAYIYPFK